MILDVGEPTGLGDSEKQALHVQWDTTDAVMLSLAREGFNAPTQPRTEQPVVTGDMLANSTGAQYSNWFMAYAGWQQFMSYRVNWILAKKLEIDNEMKILAAHIRKRMRAKEGKKPSEDVISDEVLTDPRYIELMQMQQVFKQQELLLESQYEYIKNAIRLLSRHLAVRQLEADLSGRGGRAYGNEFR